MAACADSCITSPSFPVSSSLPFPCISVDFNGQNLAAHFRPSQSGRQTHLVLLFRLGVAELEDSEVFFEVIRPHRNLQRCGLL